MSKPRDVLTTGEVARICNVAPRTVSKWFDSGQLRGYRIPGSRDRRIPIAQLIRFMEAHGIPLNDLEAARPSVLLVDCDEQYVRVLSESLGKDTRFTVHAATSAFEAGIVLQECRPQVLVMDVSLPGADAKEICRTLRGREELHRTRLIATGAALNEGRGQSALQDGFDAYLPKPFEIRQLVKLIDQTTSDVA
jgi:excisionase family DNA binding protein